MSTERPEPGDGGRTEPAAELGGSYEAVVEHAPDAIVVLDLDAGRFVTANAAAERLFGLPRERLLEVGPTDVSPPFQPDGRASRDVAQQYIALALQGETPRFEWTHLDARGQPIPCEISLLRLPDPTRTLVCWTVVDVRDRKRAAEQIVSDDYDRQTGRTDYTLSLHDALPIYRKSVV